MTNSEDPQARTVDPCSSLGFCLLDQPGQRGVTLGTCFDGIDGFEFAQASTAYSPSTNEQKPRPCCQCLREWQAR